MQIQRASLVLLLGVGLLGGCGDDATGPSAFERLRVLAGADVADTVLSPLLQALIVDVRDENGRPLEGIVVRFEGVLIDAQNQWGGLTASVSPLDRESYTGFAVDSTDHNGRAGTLVQLGTKAGDARIVITVPEIGVVDTAHFTVQPGNAVSVVASPEDTTMYVGRRFTPQSTVVDRYHNLREEQVEYRVVGPAAALKDGSVEGRAIGKSTLIASFDTLADTVSISVIPEMTLAAINGLDIIMVNGDGSGYRILASDHMGQWIYPFTTDWAPSGNELVFDHGGGDGPIAAVDLAGNLRTVSTSDEWGLYSEVSPDGSWVYYSRDFGGWHLYRVHLDGTGEEAVPMASPGSDVAPSVSPDGRRLVYVLNGSERLMLLDLATGESTDLHVNGHSPAWSPTGDLIAFVSSSGRRLHTIAPDGTGERQVGSSVSSYEFGIDWSPDGRWLIARNASYNRIDLIAVPSGESYPLKFTSGFQGPSWRP